MMERIQKAVDYLTWRSDGTYVVYDIRIDVPTDLCRYFAVISLYTVDKHPFLYDEMPNFKPIGVLRGEKTISRVLKFYNLNCEVMTFIDEPKNFDFFNTQLFKK